MRSKNRLIEKVRRLYENEGSNLPVSHRIAWSGSISEYRGRYSATAFHRVSDSTGFINGHYVRARRVDLRLSKLF